LLNFLKFSDLDEKLLKEYRHIVSSAFPKIIGLSQVIRDKWPRLESYFPEHQIIALDAEGSIVGMMNTVPLHWDSPLSSLPDRGWDWMLQKGIQDHEQGISANHLGGLQVIVSQPFQGKGFSKLIISEAKKLLGIYAYKNFIIPIRPTKKHLFPDVPMSSYITKKIDDNLYDPWIRTHVKCGAEVVKVCSESMLIHGDLSFWKDIMQKESLTSGKHIVNGALNRVDIDVENNYGEYKEENVWIAYRPDQTS